jgi:hypothetical protein
MLTCQMQILQPVNGFLVIKFFLVLFLSASSDALNVFQAQCND